VAKGKEEAKPKDPKAKPKADEPFKYIQLDKALAVLREKLPA
jgi:hypothetical protein